MTKLVLVGVKKICTKCKEEKFLSRFHKAPKQKFGVRPDCKVCQHKKQRESSVKVDARTRRNQSLKSDYGITLDQYESMFKAQDGQCKICKGLNTDLRKINLCVDHNHETKKVRGLLCHNCNVGLGNFKDDEFVLRRALIYLRLSK